MIGDAIDSGQWVGMVLLKPGFEEEYAGSPEIHPVGCAGSLDHWSKHDDGKYDIVLRGQSRFRIVREVGDTLYRQAEVELLNNGNDQAIDPSSELYKQLIGKFHAFTSQLPLDNAQKVEMDLQDCKMLSEAVDRVAYFFRPTPDRPAKFSGRTGRDETLPTGSRSNRPQTTHRPAVRPLLQKGNRLPLELTGAQ